MINPRFTRRTLAIAAAVVALLVAVVVVGKTRGRGRGDRPWFWENWEPTRRYYLDQAAVFERMEVEYRNRASSIAAGATVARRPGEPEGKAERLDWSRAQAESFRRNAQDFRLFADRPWDAAKIHAERTSRRR